MSDATQEKQGGAGAPDDKKKEVPVHSNTPENRDGRLNPSAPEASNTTPEDATEGKEIA